jgi:subtilisin-like proprotein convertase family protein
VDLELATGVPSVLLESANPELAIPDNNPSGITSTVIVSGTGAAVGAGLEVDIDITHTWRGDLIVRLESPTGTEILLHDESGGSEDDLVGTYPTTLTPAQSLAALVGEPLDGTWTLFVSDNAGQDLGTLHAWGIREVLGWDCEPVGTAAGDPLSVRRFALTQNHPNPFNPATVIEFSVPEDAGEVYLEIFDVSGRLVRRLAGGVLAAGEHGVVWQGRDESGRAVGSGVYYYRLRARDFEETRRMVLVR